MKRREQAARGLDVAVGEARTKSAHASISVTTWRTRFLHRLVRQRVQRLLSAWNGSSALGDAVGGDGWPRRGSSRPARRWRDAEAARPSLSWCGPGIDRRQLEAVLLHRTCRETFSSGVSPGGRAAARGLRCNGWSAWAQDHRWAPAISFSDLMAALMRAHAAGVGIAATGRGQVMAVQPERWSRSAAASRPPEAIEPSGTQEMSGNDANKALVS